MLWKAADQHGPPHESDDITHFGWEFRDGIPVPVIAQCDPAPTQLIDVIKCQCKALGKKCSTDACGCHKEHMSCTSYCNCSGKEGCCNQYTNIEDAQAGHESVETVDVDDDDDVEDEKEDNADRDDVADEAEVDDDDYIWTMAGCRPNFVQHS